MVDSALQSCVLLWLLQLADGHCNWLTLQVFQVRVNDTVQKVYNRGGGLR